jgi:hypothetical protein
MYHEKASFLDKFINTLLSPFDRFIFKSNHSIGNDSYMQILNGGEGGIRTHGTLAGTLVF